MNYITNELGKRIIASGSWDSPIRMLEKYPITMLELEDIVYNSNRYDYTELKERCIDNGVEPHDIPNVLSAVHFYTASYFSIKQ